MSNNPVSTSNTTSSNTTSGSSNTINNKSGSISSKSGAGAGAGGGEWRAPRIAIVDIDIHHGNGTEEIVRNLR